MITQIVVGISGPAGSGKDHAADVMLEKLQENGIPAAKYSFAFPIKNVAQFLFGLTDDEMYSEEGKKEISRYGYGMTNRKILQLIGTESFRDVFNENIWIDFAERFIAESGVEVIIIPDVRFENEAEFIKANGYLITVDPTGREGFEEISEKDHASEKGFTSKPNVVIENKGTVEEFNEEVKARTDIVIDAWNVMRDISTSRMQELREVLISSKKQLFSM